MLCTEDFSMRHYIMSGFRKLGHIIRNTIFKFSTPLILIMIMIKIPVKAYIACIPDQYKIPATA